MIENYLQVDTMLSSAGASGPVAKNTITICILFTTLSYNGAKTSHISKAVFIVTFWRSVS